MGIVYAVLFDNGLFKVGRTRNLQARIRSHISSGKSFGYGLDVFLFTEQHEFFERTEEKLLNYCRGRFQANSPEYFEGGDYHSVKEVMMRAGTLVGWGNSLATKDGAVIVSMPELQKTKETKKIKESNTIKEKIIRLLKGKPDGLTEGVIKNRCRPNEVYDDLMELLGAGEIRVLESKHPKTLVTVRTFSSNT